MYPKELIMNDLLDRIGSHPDAPLVTEDLSKVAALDFLPMVLIVEGNDEVIDIGLSHGEVINTRQATIMIISFVQAETDELGAQTMRRFQADLRKCIYKDQQRRIGDNAGIREKSQSQIVPAPTHNSVFCQQLTFLVDYRENISKLFE